MRIWIILFSIILCTTTVRADTYSKAEEAFTSKQYTVAAPLFQKLADQDDFRAQYYIGYMYLYGYGISQDENRAIQYLQKSSNHGYDMAQTLIAYLYHQGIGIPQDKTRAINLYREAADQRNTSALLNLGIAYYQGDGVTQDIARALDFLTKVPLTEYPIAGRYLGDIYLKSAQEDRYTKAIDAFTGGARNGDIGSYTSLAQMHQRGTGVATNMRTALEFYTYAASQNDATAQYMLGIIYANGDEVPRDTITGHAWLTLASNQGLTQSKQALAQLEQEMTLNDINLARHKLIELQQKTIGKLEPPLKVEEAAPVKEETKRTSRRRARRR